MKTVQELFGVDLPIVQAPMAGVQGSAMALAVCNAGGLGSLPCALLSPETRARELRAMADGTRRPFNVNFFCHSPPEIVPSRELAWQQALAPYGKELGVSAAVEAAPRMPFDDEAAAALEAVRPRVVSFHFGLPSEELLARVRSLGAMIISSATTVEEARWLAARGVDAIVAQGLEAGGHRGMFLTDDVTTQMGTMALLPQVIAAVDVPVIASGGIVDHQGVLAALALGAAGVQVGTAYLLCHEATTSAVHRAALKSEAARHTALTNVFSGRPARSVVNRLMREMGPLSPLPPPFPRAAIALAPLRARAESLGSGDFSRCGRVRTPAAVARCRPPT